MPELPEMETYRRLLSERIVELPLSAVEVNREKSINVPAGQFKQELVNAKITAIHRRAKHLIFRLSNGKALLLHLMLGGWMYWGDEQDNPERTKQVILRFGGKSLYFIGLRLGYLHLLDPDRLEAELADLGPEPLDMTLEDFQRMSESRKGMLKTTLVNQGVIAGIGNCYSDEICFEAGVQPVRKFNQLEASEIAALYNGMRTVFNRALAAGGYMDQPLYSGDSFTGGYNEQCRVYDREGEPCFRCRTPVRKELISSRKTFYCPECQQ